jgi:hypothetical protein
LKPAQWSVLRYLQRANPSARSITAFAQFHATTKSASSQTVRLLVRKGLVTMVQDVEDSRRKRLDLTDTGRAVLEHDPLQGIVVTLGNSTPVRFLPSPRWWRLWSAGPSAPRPRERAASANAGQRGATGHRVPLPGRSTCGRL